MSDTAVHSYRPEIQGLRAIAALLVAIYHIWLGRVSGGVDVFFVVSGFLVIGSLLRQVERHGQVQFSAFWGNLAKRLLPIALLVIGCTLLASLWLLPQVRWGETAKELFAASLYYENWQLAFNAVDYLAQDNAPSPVQHYWALSIQGQFYLIWPLLIGLLALAHRGSPSSLRHLITSVVSLVFIASLIYSIIRTAQDQPFTYFDAFARAWEFALGGLLAIWLPKIKLPTPWLAVLGWVGVLGILSCGLILPVSTAFPGYIALWPTLAAGFVLLAGSYGGRFGAHRLLTSRPLMQLGDVSYALYLWHWPLLIFWQLHIREDQVGLFDGLVILLTAIVLAFASTRWVEAPIRNSTIGKLNPARALYLSAALMAPILIGIAAWTSHINAKQRELERLAENPAYPGVMVRLPNFPSAPTDIPFIPSALQAKKDLPSTYASRCHQMPRAAEVLSCSFGPEQATYTIALVGGSHSAHWLPALQRLAEENGIRVVNYTKSACRFIDGKRGHPSCEVWNNGVIDALEQLKPDLVFTTATIGRGEKEEVPLGYIKQWAKLAPMGIEVMALRDNPRPDFDVPACVEQHGNNSEACQLLRSDVLKTLSPFNNLEGLTSNVLLVDYSEYFCEATYCPVVIGNVVVYRDSHHLTTVFARSFAPILWASIAPKIEAKKIP